MIYFDNGATTYPKPQSVINAVNNAMRLYAANPGRSGHSMSIKAAEKVFECRQNAAKLFNSKTPENVIFTNNCTMALNTVIKGVLNTETMPLYHRWSTTPLCDRLNFSKTREWTIL